MPLTEPYDDHYSDEESLAALVMAIASINAWNRLNVSVRNLATD